MMNWFKGNIAEAVAKSKTNGSVFVVYVEGKDENSQKLSGYINDSKICSQLESDNFVAIKVEGGSETYMQFASIYQVVPVPSIFFIGKTGTPLEIATGIIASVDELLEKINKVLVAAGKPTTAVSATSSASFIASEQQATSSSVLKEQAADPQKAEVPKNEQEEEEIVCEGDVCYKKKKETIKPAGAIKENVASGSTRDSVDTTVTATASTPEKEKEKEDAEAEAEARLEDTRKRLEQKRRERIEEEKKVEKERELRRRREGKEMQNLQEWQKEHELKELKENLRRDRLEEQAARERIRAQIAADRVERARKFAPESPQPDDQSAANNNNNVSTPPINNADAARLQFRLSNGASKTHSFGSQDTLETVRNYVKTDLLPGTGIKDYILATTYPKREFTAEHDTQTLQQLGLAPTAVILVIGKEGVSPVALIKRSGGIVNILTTLFWTILSPVYAVFGYFRNLVRRGGDGATKDNAATVGAQKRANEEQGAQHDAAKRRNLDRLMGGPSTSKNTNDGDPTTTNESKAQRRYGGSNIHRLRDNRNDSDDENATWNGNSTQQQ